MSAVLGAISSGCATTRIGGRTARGGSVGRGSDVRPGVSTADAGGTGVTGTREFTTEPDAVGVFDAGVVAGAAHPITTTASAIAVHRVFIRRRGLPRRSPRRSHRTSDTS